MPDHYPKQTAHGSIDPTSPQLWDDPEYPAQEAGDPSPNSVAVQHCHAHHAEPLPVASDGGEGLGVMRVFIASPYAGDIERNERYLLRCIADCFRRGEAPFAGHGLYPRVLDDGDPEQRKLGMDAGLAFLDVCELVAVYTDYGESTGMRAEIDYAEHWRHVERREIGKNDE